ncbi:MAG: sugar ABC transporter permease [Ruminococcaceae bacterium]|nr:sugar ABC transporter permease [Oscillospiraceae bacterium]
MKAKKTFSTVLQDVWKHKTLYFMLIPGIIWAVVFCYIPMYGIIIAFKDYSPGLGFFGSPWAGFKHFEAFFGKDFLRIMRNTLLISGGTLLAGFPAPILFALLLTSVKNKVVRKVGQTLSYVPHFVSWVVVSAICFILFAPESGTINAMLRNIGLIEGSIGFLENGPLFDLMLIIANVWKSTGFSAIIYFAAIAGVDAELYEAATIDGAKSMQQIWYITIPAILPTVIVMLVLNISGILNAGFEQQMVMASDLVWKWADVIDTYSFRYGLSKLRYSYGTAIGLFKSIVALILLMGSNAFMKKVSGYSLYK